MGIFRTPKKKDDFYRSFGIKEKSASRRSRVILILVVILVSVVVFGSVAYGLNSYMKLGNLEYVSTESTLAYQDEVDIIDEPTPPKELPTFKPPTPSATLSITPTSIPEMENDIMNILILGCDTRKPNQFQDSRSDVNIILTIDKKNQQVRMTSILRDTLLYYEEIEDYQRMNYALRLYDDPYGVIDIIEKNFGINIDHYMMADFWGVASLVDIFNGVEVDASEGEISNLNDILWNLNELYEYEDLRKDFVTDKPGMITLNGRQAVSYMRVRKVGSDFERVERQYEVLDALKSEINDMDFFKMNKILQQLPNLIRTDMNEIELLSTANTLYKMRDCEMTNARLPFNGTYKTSSYKGMWVLEINLEKNAKYLQDFVYNAIMP